VNDILIIGMDVEPNVRLTGEDGRFKHLLKELLDRHFRHIFILTVGENINGPHIAGVPPEHMFHLCTKKGERSRNKKVSGWQTLGFKGLELIAKVKAQVLQELSETTANNNRLTAPWSMKPSLNSISMILLSFVIFLAALSQVGPCFGSPATHQNLSVFDGRLNVPQGLVPPSCNFSELLDVLEKNITGDLKACQNDLDENPKIFGARAVLQSLTGQLPTMWLEIMSCEQKHREFSAAMAAFYREATSLHVVYDYVSSEKCFFHGKNEIRIPKFLSYWL
jgi:hypothetical protein